MHCNPSFLRSYANSATEIHKKDCPLNPGITLGISDTKRSSSEKATPFGSYAPRKPRPIPPHLSSSLTNPPPLTQRYASDHVFQTFQTHAQLSQRKQNVDVNHKTTNHNADPHRSQLTPRLLPQARNCLAKHHRLFKIEEAGGGGPHAQAQAQILTH